MKFADTIPGTCITQVRPFGNKCDNRSCIGDHWVIVARDLNVFYESGIIRLLHMTGRYEWMSTRVVLDYFELME